MKEALQHEDLQIPGVLDTGQASSSACLYMEDLSPNQRQKINCGFDPEQERDTESLFLLIPPAQ